MCRRAAYSMHAPMQRPARKSRVLAGGTIAGVVVEATHLDGAGAGVAVDDHLHDGRGLANLGVAVVLGLREDAGGADDQRIDVRIERLLRVAVAIGEVGRLDVAALHEILDHRVGAQISAHRRIVELLLADALHRFEHRGRIGLAQQADQLAGVDEAGHVGGAIDLGRTHGRIHHVGRRESNCRPSRSCRMPISASRSPSAPAE